MPPVGTGGGKLQTHVVTCEVEGRVVSLYLRSHLGGRKLMDVGERKLVAQRGRKNEILDVHAQFIIRIRLAREKRAKRGTEFASFKGDLKFAARVAPAPFDHGEIRISTKNFPKMVYLCVRVIYTNSFWERLRAKNGHFYQATCLQERLEITSIGALAGNRRSLSPHSRYEVGIWRTIPRCFQFCGLLLFEETLDWLTLEKRTCLARSLPTSAPLPTLFAQPAAMRDCHSWLPQPASVTKIYENISKTCEKNSR